MEDVCKVCGHEILDFPCFPECGKDAYEKKVKAAESKPKKETKTAK